jgi:hypothetical protein
MERTMLLVSVFTAARNVSVQVVSCARANPDRNTGKRDNRRRVIFITILILSVVARKRRLAGSHRPEYPETSLYVGVYTVPEINGRKVVPFVCLLELPGFFPESAIIR